MHFCFSIMTVSKQINSYFFLSKYKCFFVHELYLFLYFLGGGSLQGSDVRVFDLNLVLLWSKSRVSNLIPGGPEPCRVYIQP